MGQFPEFDEINLKLDRIQSDLNKTRAMIFVVWMAAITATFIALWVLEHN